MKAFPTLLLLIGLGPGIQCANETDSVALQTITNATRVIFSHTNASGAYQMNLSNDGHVLTYHHEDKDADKGTFRSESFIVSQSKAMDPRQVDQIRIDMQDKLGQMQEVFSVDSMIPSALQLHSSSNSNGTEEENESIPGSLHRKRSTSPASPETTLSNLHA